LPPETIQKTMKTILVRNGVLAGLIVSATLVLSMAFVHERLGFEWGMAIGYSSMLLAFSLIFTGLKTYRDQHPEGVLTLKDGLLLGLGISLIASTLYVVTWLVDYHFFMPDFIEKFGAMSLEKSRAAGASAEELRKEAEAMAEYREMYKSPIGVALITYMEILPVALLVTVVSAFWLKRGPVKVAA
jgi:hypothetical protein